MIDILSVAFWTVVVLLATIVITYTVARISSIAHFRTRSEYDRGMLESWRKRDDEASEIISDWVNHQQQGKRDTHG